MAATAVDLAKSLVRVTILVLEMVLSQRAMIARGTTLARETIQVSETILARKMIHVSEMILARETILVHETIHASEMILARKLIHAPEMALDSRSTFLVRVLSTLACKQSFAPGTLSMEAIIPSSTSQACQMSMFRVK